MSGSSDAHDAWVKRVLGFDVTDPGLDIQADDPLDLRNRLAEATKQIEALQATGDPAELSDLVGAHAAAARAVESRAQNAGDMMDLLERQLARSRQEARYREESAELSGKVAYAKLLLRWRQAQGAVLDRVETLGSLLRNHPEVQEDEDPEELLDLIDDFPTLIPEFGAELDDILDDARKPGADLEELHDAARDVLRRYRAELARMSALQELEDLARSAGAGSLALYTELESALDELEAELGKAG